MTLSLIVERAEKGILKTKTFMVFFKGLIHFQDK